MKVRDVGGVVQGSHFRSAGSALQRKVVSGLHSQPRPCCPGSRLLQTDGEVGADPGVSVQDPAQRDPRDAQAGSRLTDPEPEIGQDVLTQDLARVHRRLHRHLFTA